MFGSLAKRWQPPRFGGGTCKSQEPKCPLRVQGRPFPLSGPPGFRASPGCGGSIFTWLLPSGPHFLCSQDYQHILGHTCPVAPSGPPFLISCLFPPPLASGSCSQGTLGLCHPAPLVFVLPEWVLLVMNHAAPDRIHLLPTKESGAQDQISPGGSLEEYPLRLGDPSCLHLQGCWHPGLFRRTLVAS